MEAVLGVLGSILLFIGTALLWILGILLGIILLFLLLLAVPIRFRLRGAYGGEGREGQGEISYFLRILRLNAYFKEDRLAWRATVFGRQITGSESSPEPEEEELEEPAEETVEHVYREPQEPPGQTGEALTPPTKPQPSGKVETEEPPDWVKKGMRPIKPIKPVDAGFWERLGARLSRYADLWEKFKAYPHKQEIWRAARRAIGKILRSLRLRNSTARIRFGWKDPANTGLTLGAASMIGQFLTGDGCHIELEPDFDGACLEVDGKLEFRVRILYILWVGLCLLGNRHVRELLLFALKKARKRAD